MAVPAGARIRRVNTTVFCEVDYGQGWETLKSFDLPGLPDQLQVALVYQGTPVATHSISIRSEN